MNPPHLQERNKQVNYPNHIIIIGKCTLPMRFLFKRKKNRPSPDGLTCTPEFYEGRGMLKKRIQDPPAR